MKRSIIMLSLIPMLLSGCKENEVMDYQLPAAVYFYEYNLISTVEQPIWEKNYSFALQNESVTDHIMQIQVQLMGNVADRDRTFRAVAVPENTTAVEGKHYKILDGVMKAGEYLSYLPVEIYRTDDTKSEAVELQLLLVDTDDLKAGNGSAEFPQSEYRDRTNQIKFTVIWGDILLQPDNWPTYYWGAYNENKYRFAIDFLDQTDWPIYSRYDTGYEEGKYTTAQIINYGVQLNAAYEEYKLTHGPIYNDDNTAQKTEIYYGV